MKINVKDIPFWSPHGKEFDIVHENNEQLKEAVRYGYKLGYVKAQDNVILCINGQEPDFDYSIEWVENEN